MAFWSKKKKEEVHRYDLAEKPKEKKEEVKVRTPDFIDDFQETNFEFGRIVDIRKNRGGFSAKLIISPSYLFPRGSQRIGVASAVFSDGLLLVDGIASRISNINLDISVSDPSKSHIYDYRPYYDGGIRLSFERQVLSNAFDGLKAVPQTKKAFLTDCKYRIDIRLRLNIEATNQLELRYQISSIVDKVKKAIEDNFRKEIVKSKLIESKEKFFTDLSPELMSDIFQHVTDLVPSSKLIIGQESIKFFVPLIGKSNASSFSRDKQINKFTFDFNEKTSNILYELSETVNRIKGYCENSSSKISFSSDGITVETSPDIISEHLENMEDNNTWGDPIGMFSREMLNREIRIRNPYNDWNLE